MNWGRAFIAGAIGGTVMSILLLIVRAMGMPANLELMQGTMLGLDPGASALIVGFIMHLVISGLIALIYAAGFEYVTHRSGWLMGAAFSIVHLLVGGIVMGVVPAMHPLIPEQMPAPGYFMSGMGAMGVALFTVAHLIYGAIVGALYTTVHHPAHREAVV